MMFLRYHLRRLKKASAPDQNYKAALRARLLASQQPVYVPARVSVFRYAFATAAFALILFLSTGTYAYASSAVTEGTMLYPVKTTIEEVEGSFQRTPEQQARFHAKIMHRRMKEVAYQLKHKKTVPPGLMRNVAKEMDLTVDEVRDLKDDKAGRKDVKAVIKTDVIEALEEMRAYILASDFSEAEKQQYLHGIDARIEKLQRIKTTTPSE